MSPVITAEEAGDLADRVQDRLGESLHAVGFGWHIDDFEFFHVRDDVQERYGEDVLEDIGADLLVDRHLESGNLRRHGLEGPTLSGRLYRQALIVVCWMESLPVAVVVDPDPDHFAAVTEVLQDALEAPA